MKTKLKLFIILTICTLSSFAQKKTNREFKDILDLDAIKSDKDYFSQSVIQFQLVEKIIEKYSDIYHLFPKENPSLFLKRRLTAAKDTLQFDIDNGVPTMVLFGNTSIDGDSNKNRINEKFYKLGVDRCQYKIPMSLDELDSGFQFNHYMFKSKNEAALEAFGIVKNNYDSESLYIVIDYIQFKDNLCPGVPKIRYGVGIRSEIRISNWKNNFEIKESSLASLAANAEINDLKVNITVKTIGITGLDSKMNIPSNTSFDVDTFADYQKIIDFIRQFDNSTTKSKTEFNESINKIKDTALVKVLKDINNNKSLKEYDDITFKPQLIPVMNEYRTTISQSFAPFYETLDELEKRMSKLKGQKNKYERFKKNVNTSRLDSAMVYMYDEKINSIIDELKSVKKKKQILKRANIADIDLENYVGILELMNSVDYNRTNDDNLDKLDEKINKISDEIKNVSGDEWFIVVGGDTTLPLAKFELAKAVAININSKIIKRQNSYRTVICGFKTKEDSELKLQEAKDKINVTSYIVKKSSWCKVLIEGKEYSTCE